MIVLGVDPGARWTGLALIDYRPGTMPDLIDSLTVDRRDLSLYDPRRPPEGASNLADPLDLPDGYLAAVTEWTGILLNHNTSPATLVGVEWVRRPSWRVKGREKPIDPAAIMATAIVAGAVVAKLLDSPVPVERVRPMGNGRLFPLPHYPDPIRTTGAGHDKRRHERSAFDVALMAAQQRSQAR